MPNPPQTDREAALERVKKAKARVAAALPIMTGRSPTPEEKQALQAATEELRAAGEALRAAGGKEGDPAVDAALADLRKRTGGSS